MAIAANQNIERPNDSDIVGEDIGRDVKREDGRKATRYDDRD